MNNNRLDPKYIFAIVLALSFLVLGLWYTFRYQARQEEMSNLRTEIETATTEVNTYREAQKQLPALRQEVAQMETERAQFVAALPQTNDMSQVLSELRANATANGVDIRGISADGSSNSDNTNLPGGVRAIPLQVSMSGTYGEIYRTLQTAETMRRFSNVVGLTMDMPQASSFNPDLNGTLDMTVYTFDSALAAAPVEGGAGSGEGTDSAPTAPAAPTADAPAASAPAEGGGQ